MTVEDARYHASHVTAAVFGNKPKAYLDPSIYKNGIYTTYFMAMSNAYRDIILMYHECWDMAEEPKVFDREIYSGALESFMIDDQKGINQIPDRFIALFHEDYPSIDKKDVENSRIIANHVIRSIYNGAPKKKLTPSQFYYPTMLVYLLGEREAYKRAISVFKEFKEDLDSNLDEYKGEMDLILLEAWNLTCSSKAGSSAFIPMTLEDILADKPSYLFVNQGVRYKLKHDNKWKDSQYSKVL